MSIMLSLHQKLCYNKLFILTVDDRRVKNKQYIDVRIKEFEICDLSLVFMEIISLTLRCPWRISAVNCLIIDSDKPVSLEQLSEHLENQMKKLNQPQTTKLNKTKLSLVSLPCTTSDQQVDHTHGPSFLSASLYVSKRGAYWDRLCRDVVGRWLVGRWLVVGCHVRALWPNGAS